MNQTILQKGSTTTASFSDAKKMNGILSNFELDVTPH